MSALKLPTTSKKISSAIQHQSQQLIRPLLSCQRNFFQMFMLCLARSATIQCYNKNKLLNIFIFCIFQLLNRFIWITFIWSFGISIYWNPTIGHFTAKFKQNFIHLNKNKQIFKSQIRTFISWFEFFSTNLCFWGLWTSAKLQKNAGLSHIKNKQDKQKIHKSYNDIIRHQKFGECSPSERSLIGLTPWLTVKLKKSEL